MDGEGICYGHNGSREAAWQSTVLVLYTNCRDQINRVDGRHMLFLSYGIHRIHPLLGRVFDLLLFKQAETYTI